MHYYLLQTAMSKRGKFYKELLLHWKLLRYLRNYKEAEEKKKVRSYVKYTHTSTVK